MEGKQIGDDDIRCPPIPSNSASAALQNQISTTSASAMADNSLFFETNYTGYYAPSPADPRPAAPIPDDLFYAAGITVGCGSLFDLLGQDYTRTPPLLIPETELTDLSPPSPACFADGNHLYPTETSAAAPNHQHRFSPSISTSDDDERPPPPPPPPPPAPPAGSDVKEDLDCHDDDKAPKQQEKEKTKKKGQKRQREPRYAFLTKSDVDHLDDGFRWRKYGQKAVKKSPFPRSYYRCTAATCGVKKRVERSSEEPGVVITTYEGQHTHPCPVTVPRGSPCFLLQPSHHVDIPNQSYSPFYHNQTFSRPSAYYPSLSSLTTTADAETTTSSCGMLEDMIIYSQLHDQQQQHQPD